MDYEKLYINGEWIPGASGEFIEVENPATREIFARVPAGNGDDVDKAAKAAYAAFPAWAKKPLAERITLMERFLTIFKSQEDDLIDITIRELGSPYAFTKVSQVEYQYVRTMSYIDLAPDPPWSKKWRLPPPIVSRSASSDVSLHGTTPWDRSYRRSYLRC